MNVKPPYSTKQVNGAYKQDVHLSISIREPKTPAH